MTEVGAEERIARRIANFPRRLRCEGGDVEELSIRLVSTRVKQSVGPIPAAAVIRYRAIRVGLGDRLPGPALPPLLRIVKGLPLCQTVMVLISQPASVRFVIPVQFLPY